MIFIFNTKSNTFSTFIILSRNLNHQEQKAKRTEKEQKGLNSETILIRKRLLQ